MKTLHVMTIGALAFLATSLSAQVDVGKLIALPDYVVWCTDRLVPRTADDKTYYSMLAEGVGAIDSSIGAGATTGTPFVARSIHKTITTTDSTGATIQQDNVVLTVCAAVSSTLAAPSSDQVHRELRTNEQVFAGQCPIENAADCGYNLLNTLASRLKAPLSDDVPKLFWRSVSGKKQAANAEDLRHQLTASDVRSVTVAPQVSVTGDPAKAADLSKPIDQQQERPLLGVRPSWFNVIRQPDDKWIVVAISVSSEMATALQQ